MHKHIKSKIDIYIGKDLKPLEIKPKKQAINVFLSENVIIPLNLDLLIKNCIVHEYLAYQIRNFIISVIINEKISNKVKIAENETT